MKKLFFITLFILATKFSYAQHVNFGIKAGTNLGIAEIEDNKINWESDGLQFGLHAGAFTRINLFFLYIQPELYYSFVKSAILHENNQTTVDKLNFNFHRLDAPILLGIRLGRNFRVNAGPFASVVLGTSADGSNNRDLEDQIEKYYDKTLFGWQAGFGFDFGRVTFDSRYETTIGNLRDYDFDNSSVQDYLPDDQKQRQLVVSLGYKLNYKKPKK